MYEVIEQFIWKNKKPKIPLKILQQSRENGGLGLVNLVKKYQALSTSWIYLCITNPSCCNLAEYFLKVPERMIWKCNLSKQDAENMFSEAYFWKNVICSWCEFNFQIPQSYSTIVNQVVWYNLHLRINNKVISPKGGLPMELRISDLLSSDGKWLHLSKIKECYPDSSLNWLELKSIQEALPNYFKIIICDQDDDLEDPYIENFPLVSENAKYSKTVYKKLNCQETAFFKSAHYWEKRLPNFCYDSHKRCFRNLYLVTNVTKLRNFQYRLLHNKIFCNNILFYWKKVPSQCCEFCTKEI